MAALDEIARGTIASGNKPRAIAHEAKGGKVVGYFSNNVPVELIAAAGMFPGAG